MGAFDMCTSVFMLKASVFMLKMSATAESEQERAAVKGVIGVRIVTVQGIIGIPVIPIDVRSIVVGRRLIIDTSCLQRISIHQPGSRSLVEAGPTPRRLIRKDILLRRRTRVTQRHSIPHNRHALDLLPVNNDHLSNTLLCLSGLCERSAGEAHERTDYQHGKKKFLCHDSPRRTYHFRFLLLIFYRVRDPNARPLWPHRGHSAAICPTRCAVLRSSCSLSARPDLGLISPSRSRCNAGE